MRLPRHARVQWLALALTLLLACAQEKREAPAGPIRLRTIDSAEAEYTWNDYELNGGAEVYRVEVQGAGRVDTLSDIIYPMPFGVDGDTVAGLRLFNKDKHEGERHLFVYLPANREMRTWPVPDDVWWHFYDVVISPDARYVAYVGADSSGTYPIVRELFTGRIIMRGAGGGGCECDSDRNHARWLNADSVEIAVAHHLGDEGFWLRLTGRPSKRVVHLDTLESAPKWH
jgi:hypothetical protein